MLDPGLQEETPINEKDLRDHNQRDMTEKQYMIQEYLKTNPGAHTAKTIGIFLRGQV